MKVALVIGIVSLSLLYVWERVDLVRLGYQIQQLEGQYQRLERERNELKVKRSALSSPEYIARIATKRLGMVRPEPGQVVLVTFETDGTQGNQFASVKVRLAKNELVKR